MANLLRDCNGPGGDEKFLGAIIGLEPKAPLRDATAGNVTYLSEVLLRGILVRDGGAANRTDVFPTAALLVAALAAKYGAAQVGMMIDFMVVNDTATANTVAITLGAGMTSGLTNGTQVSSAIAQNASRRYTIKITNVTAATEAAVVYA